MTDRNAYMRDYMRARRQKGKAVAVNAEAVNCVNTELTEDRLRAIVREELDRALKPLRELLTQLTVSSVNTPPDKALPEPEGVRNYWKPDPTKPREQRCQGTNQDGARCSRQGKAIVLTSDSSGRPAEFVSCERHQAAFKPHASLFTETP